MIQNLNHAYDEYLKAHEPEAIKAIPLFLKNLEKTYFRYGRYTIPTFFKPFLVTQRQEQILKSTALTVSEIISRATRLYFEQEHLAGLFHLNSEVAELIKIDPGYSQPVVFARYDAILAGDSLKLVEFNCDSPAGAAYTDQIENALLAEEMLQGFIGEHHLHATTRAQAILDTLLAVYEEFGGYETPNIAIVDWRTVRTRPEFEYLQSHFESKGYHTVIADPRDLRYKGGKLYYKNEPIRLILRRVIFDELVERLSDVQDLIKAYRDRAVCVVNPLRSRLASTKALLSVLTNTEYDHYFTDKENKAKKEFVPWTRRIQDAENFYGHKKLYLIDFLKEEKETLVLKPSLSYGGRDVTIGCETPDEKWNETIDKALKGDWVVQEYVSLPTITVPVVINKKLDFDYKKYNCSALISGGKYGGGFVRVSNESVVNVARGGGLIPAIVPDHTPDRYGLDT